MNKYAPFLLLDLVVDVDSFLLDNKLNLTTIKNIKKIKLFIELLAQYISFINYLEDNMVDEKEFNEKINLITKKYMVKIRGVK